MPTAYETLQSTRAAYDAALLATFGDAAGHFRYSGMGRGDAGTDLRAAWNAMMAADRAYYAPDHARVA